MMLAGAKRGIRQIMLPGKTYRHACFAWAKGATTSFAWATDAKDNLQPTIYNHKYVQKRLIDT